MTGKQAGAKSCVVCGTDLSGKPRTKDPKGRYFCQPCYDKARAHTVGHHHAADAASSPPKSRPAPAPMPASKSAPVEPEDGPINILEELIAAVPPIVGGPVVMPSCPKCSAIMPAGGVICGSCGYNIQSKSRIGTQISRAKHQGGGVFWPPIMGIISMVFGIGGTIGYGLMLIGALFGMASPRSSFRENLISLATISLLTWLAVWLLRDGWRILQRNSDGVKWIRFWAMAKLLIYGTCMTIALNIPAEILKSIIEQSQQRGWSPASVSDVKSAILLFFLWFMAWPIIVLIFFFIPRIMNDVDQWD